MTSFCSSTGQEVRVGDLITYHGESDTCNSSAPRLRVTRLGTGTWNSFLAAES
jgi:hypothetical protein